MAYAVSNTTNPDISLGHIAMFMGDFQGKLADEIPELNKDYIWKPSSPIPRANRRTNQDPPNWRGKLPAHVSLAGPIYCYLFHSLPKRSDGWHHDALSSNMSHSKPRDFAYPLNTRSFISSLSFRVDFGRDAVDHPVPRLTCLQSR
jgi:hypothetical protein